MCEFHLPSTGLLDFHLNSKPSIVSLRSLLETEEFMKTNMELPVALGKTLENEVLMADLAKMPHLIVAGCSWTETTYAQHAIINSLLFKKRPEELKLVLIDTRGMNFNPYGSIASHYMPATDEGPIITDMESVVRIIKSINTLMEQRYDMLRAVQCMNIKDYNKRFKKGGLDPVDGPRLMPYVVVLINEYADLALTAGKEIEMPLIRIAQLARAVGIHVVIATRRPQFSVLNGFVKANFPARMAFKVLSPHLSRIILDNSGAEQLVGHGDMLFLNGNTPMYAQCAYVDEREVERVCKHIAGQSAPISSFRLPEPDNDLFPGRNENMPSDCTHLDPLFEKAAQIVVQTQIGSTSMLQRCFSIGYTRADRLMEQLESVGIVGPSLCANPRDVLVPDEDELIRIVGQLKARGVLSQNGLS